MYDPDFDPLRDLQQCIIDLQQCSDLINRLVGLHNNLAHENAKLLSLLKQSNQRVTLLERRMNAIEYTTKNDSKQQQ